MKRRKQRKSLEMALSPPCHGGPNIEFFKSPESMRGFEIVQEWLHYFCKKVSIRPSLGPSIRRYLGRYIE